MNSAVCAITVAYNNPGELEQLLKSLSRQSLSIDGIVVVDNSLDDMILNKNEDSLKFHMNKLSFVKYTPMNSNRGSAHGFKRGMQIAYYEGFDWVWLLDQDGLVALNCLESLLKYENTAPILCPIVYSLTNNNKMLDFRGVRNFLGNVRAIYRDDKELVPISVFGTHGVLINRAAIDETGFYDDKNFFCGWEDFDYSLRLYKNNIKILQVASAKAYHPDLTSEEKCGKLRSSSKVLLKINNYFPIPVFLGYISTKKEGRDAISRETLFNLHRKHMSALLLLISLLFSLPVIATLKILGGSIDIHATMTKYYELAKEILIRR